MVGMIRAVRLFAPAYPRRAACVRAALRSQMTCAVVGRLRVGEGAMDGDDHAGSLARIGRARKGWWRMRGYWITTTAMVVPACSTGGGGNSTKWSPGEARSQVDCRDDAPLALKVGT